MQTIFFFFYLRFQQEGLEDPCIASVNVFWVQEFTDWILLDEGLNYLVEVFDVLSRYSLCDVLQPVVAFSGFRRKQFVFRISPCRWLKKAAGAMIRRISFLDGKLDDPSSSLKIREEIS